MLSRITRSMLALALCLLSPCLSLQAADAGAPVDMNKRSEELKNLKWGMFICWSFSTFSEKEWTPGIKDISFFRAKEVDTDQWAKTAKEAEMGYILFLAKHHDGFCLWDTKTTDRKITKAPLGRDVLAELKKSCEKYGIKLAIYFSEGEFKDNKDYHPGGYTPEMKKAQLKELLTEYGPVEYIWFDHAQTDGGLNHKETLAFCKSLQPGCFIGYNHGDQEGCDIRLGEMGKPGPLQDHKAAGPHMRNEPSKNYLLAEFTYPILPGHKGGAMWFYSLPIHDGLCRSADSLYADYLGAVKFGNIFSIDVGPDFNGKLRNIDVETLRKVGEMIRNKAPMPDIPVAKEGQKKQNTTGSLSFEKPRDPRVKWFDEAKFGMFITWGLYSVPGGSWKGKELTHKYGEWIEWALPIPHDEYAAIADTWEPKQFDADAWVKTAKDAGMKYLLITAKFHDGFLMYPSKITAYNIYDRTPWKRDPVKELSEACARQGLKFGVYWNHAYDWQNPNALTPDAKASASRDFDKYINEVSLPQLREMLVDHPLISFIWFDQARGTPEMTYERGKKFADLVHSIRPEIIFNSRLGGYPADYASMGDNGIPGSMPSGVWESPCTINHTWGFKAQDTDFKSAEMLVRNLVDVASKGGNYILNVGPTGNGVIPAPEVERLKAMGNWLQINGESIYDAGHTPFGAELGCYDKEKKDSKGRRIFVEGKEWRCTVKPSDWSWGKPGKLYFHLFKWPAGKFEITGVNGKIMKSYMLADPGRKLLEMELSLKGDNLKVRLPEKTLDEIDSVLCVEVE